MLQILIDPSLLSNEAAEETINFAVNISGVSWKEGHIGIPGYIDIESYPDVENLLYPWNWEEKRRFTDMGIYWLYETDHAGPIKLMHLAETIDAAYKDDKQKFFELKEKKIHQKIFTRNDPETIIQNEVMWDYEKPDGTSLRLNDDTPDVPVPTGYLTMAISQISQNLAPLNQLGNLTYFYEGRNLTIPPNAVSFLIFPKNDDFWNGGTLQKNNNLYYIDYPDKTRVYCTVNPLPKGNTTPAELNYPIQLRDSTGDFLGTVNLSVSDFEDWVPGILQRVSPFFDLPRLFLDNLAPIKDLTWQDGTDVDAFIKQLDNFMWSTVRDTLNVQPPEIINEQLYQDIAHLVAAAYCDQQFKNESGQPEREGEDYKKAYQEQLVILNGLLIPEEKKYDLPYWKDNVKGALKDDDIGGLIFTRLAAAVNNTSALPQEKFLQWMEAWEDFLRLLKNSNIQHLILLYKWGLIIKDPAYEPFFKQVIIALGSIEHTQKQNIANYYKSVILKVDEHQDNDTLKKTIIANTANAISRYADERKGLLPLNPLITDDPFQNPPTELGTRFNWQDFLNAVKNQSVAALEKAGDELFPFLTKKYDAPPSLRIDVDSIAKLTGVLADDDLNDEIAGHIVLMRRSANTDKNEPIEFTSNWRHLNFAKITTIDGDSFKKPYIIPAFLPESNGDKIKALALSNEKLSLIAGHDTHVDLDQLKKLEAERSGKPRTKEESEEDVKEEEYKDPFRYNFGNKDDSAYGLWYGYTYQFTGFVALNSGVLPVKLRQDKAIWNVPKIVFGTEPISGAEVYTHLRRVPVSTVRIDVTDKVIIPPKGLFPIAFELPEWKGNIIARNRVANQEGTTSGAGDGLTIKSADQSFYLLNDQGTRPQKNVRFQVRKPATSLWNWYAWHGDKAADYFDDALKLDITARDLLSEQQTTDIQNIFADPAVENKILIRVTRLFPDAPTTQDILVSLEANNSLLADNELELRIEMDDRQAIHHSVDGNSIVVFIKPGEIIAVKIHSIIDANLFEETVDGKFHSWMKDGLTPYIEAPAPGTSVVNHSVFLTEAIEIWFEAAKKFELEEEMLWRNLIISEEKGDVVARIKKNQDNFKELAYGSRIEIKHQVWNWNGRLDESGKFFTDKHLPEYLDPVNGQTTAAMYWEAWSFSDRPDFSATVFETSLVAERFQTGGQPVTQRMFTDRRPGEEKALYYRFTATLYSRYELLGDAYLRAINSQIKMDEGLNIYNKWRRFLRKCSKTKPLPKPSIRFVIPLTKSIKEHKEVAKVGAAALLIVLNDKWFTEGGLAEQLELGIELLKNPVGEDGEIRYLNAGNDPILTGRGLGHVNTDNVSSDDCEVCIEFPENLTQDEQKNPIAIFKPSGPIGLTFDFTAQTPKLRGSAFVLDLPELTALGIGRQEDTDWTLNPWALVQIALRRTLRKDLCENGLTVKPLYSEWTAKEWVQFLPAADSLIPENWRKEVSQANYLDIKYHAEKIYIDGDLPIFDSSFEAFMERFLVLTEKVYDIGGQICEKYIATYLIDHVDGHAVKFELNGTKDKEDLTGKEGYVRMMLIRKPAHQQVSNTESIWERLFGESAKEVSRPDLRSIQNDPTAALPLVSERLPFKISI